MSFSPRLSVLHFVIVTLTKVTFSGIENGQTIRMTVGRKEIFVTFQVGKSDYFRRDGSDIHTDAQISLAQAALGGTVRVAGLYETQTIDVRLIGYSSFFSFAMISIILHF